MTLSAPNYQEPAVAQSFRLWLTSKNYSDSTIRNYLSDINAYFEFIKTQKNLASNIYDLASISAYLKTIQKNPAYSRYLSSLSKFFQFALDQGLISTNPLKAALRNKKPSSDEIINQYSQYLNKKHFSESTIKNYLNDIRQFTDWNQTLLSPTPVCRQAGPPLIKGGNSQQTAAPLNQGELSNEERLKGFKFFKSIFRKKEGFSES